MVDSMLNKVIQISQKGDVEKKPCVSCTTARCKSEIQNFNNFSSINFSFFLRFKRFYQTTSFHLVMVYLTIFALKTRILKSFVFVFYLLFFFTIYNARAKSGWRWCIILSAKIYSSSIFRASMILFWRPWNWIHR